MQDGKTYTWPLAFTVSKCVVDEPADKQNVQLSPFNTTEGAVQTKSLATQATTGLAATWLGKSSQARTSPSPRTSSPGPSP